MRLKKSSTLAVIFILVLSTVLIFSTSTVASPGAITVGPLGSGADFNKIQDAVNAASSGDTIEVWTGIYMENVVVNKSLNLYGAGSELTIVIASDLNQHIFNFTANNINLTGFKIRAATGATGVYLTRANHTKLANNLFENDQNGIYLYASSNCTISLNNMTNISSYGVYLFTSSNYNSFTGNNIVGGSLGVDLYLSSNYNSFTGNNISSGSYGVVVSYSSNNSFTGNNITGVSVGVYPESSSSNIFTSNIISGDYGVRLSYSSNNIFSSNNISSSFRGVSLLQSSNNNFTSNTIIGGFQQGVYFEDSSDHNCFISNNVSNCGGDGVYLNSSSYNVILWNSIKNCTDFGIFLVSSSNNIISSNNVTGNSQGGIQIDGGSNFNTLYNNYLSNALNARDDGYNYWTTSKTVGPNIVSGLYLGGNYWSDYMGVDLDGDGLGDTLLPYNCNGNIMHGGDWLPLTSPLPVHNLNTSKHFNTIQEAINDLNTLNSHTIQVDPGIYTENVVVNKSLNIYGAGAGVAVVTASDGNQHVFNITANNVSITGFKISAATNAAGVYLTQANGTNLASNLIEYSREGIYGYGSNNNTISANNMTNIGYSGVYLYGSSNNSFIGNSISSNYHGVWLDGYSNYNSFIGNSISGRNYGVAFDFSSNNSISGNNITENNYGIYLYYSYNNSIWDNFFSNSVNAWDNGVNYWNISMTTGVNIVGGPYLGGNYWSDYEGFDIDADGIGEPNLPYNSNGSIISGGDWLPLVYNPTYWRRYGATSANVAKYQGWQDLPEMNLTVTLLENCSVVVIFSMLSVSGFVPGSAGGEVRMLVNVTEMQRCTVLGTQYGDMYYDQVSVSHIEPLSAGVWEIHIEWRASGTLAQNWMINDPQGSPDLMYRELHVAALASWKP